MSQFKQRLKAEIRMPYWYRLIDAYTKSQKPRSVEQIMEQITCSTNSYSLQLKNWSLFIYTKALCCSKILLPEVHNYIIYYKIG